MLRLIKKLKKDTKENKPNETIIVDKKYDENGNLIKYDSAYTYYYSNVKDDTLLMDSLFNHFRFQFNQKFLFSEDPFFKDFFFQDSLLNYGFYTKDLFLNRFKNNQNTMDKLFFDMDSIKNLFFLEQYDDNLHDVY